MSLYHEIAVVNVNCSEEEAIDKLLSLASFDCDIISENEEGNVPILDLYNKVRELNKEKPLYKCIILTLIKWLRDDTYYISFDITNRAIEDEMFISLAVTCRD